MEGMNWLRGIAKSITAVASLTLLACGVARLACRNGFSGVEGFDGPGSHVGDVAATNAESCNSILQDHTPSERFLLLVSTMDGYVTALNGHTGSIQWAISTGSGPLLSSSISKLEIMRNGVSSRLIPSLDGGLYHMDDDAVEPVPLAADVMLSSSFRFTDDSMVIGGKDIESYGINLNSGKTRYICSSNGCKFFDDSISTSTDVDEVLIVRRIDRTVRAVEMQTGQEKWNFSVGQHDLSYLVQMPKVNQMKSIMEGLCNNEDDSEECSVESDDGSSVDDMFNFESKSSFSSSSDVDPNDVQLKVLVSNGIIFAVSRNSPGRIYWQHKFETSIASSWILENGKLTEVDLFNNQIIPILGLHDSFEENELDSNSPVLYVGTFNQQLYVQPSVRFLEEIETVTENAARSGTLVNINMPRVRGRQYLARAASQTPIITNSRSEQQIIIEENQTLENDEKSVQDATSIIRWHDYPFDGGYYLFPDYTPVKLLSHSNHSSDSVSHKNKFQIFLTNWWKEIFIGFVVMVTVCLSKILIYFYKFLVNVPASQQTQKTPLLPIHLENARKSSSEMKEEEEEELLVKESKCESKSETIYVSRYMTDFKQEACLGKGGFGVVFKVVNRLDDGIYAVKRIALHDSERARQKVMREVKALACLDHPGIVRYYQSWFESPPPGWQEEKDKSCLDISLASLATPTHEYTALKSDQSAIKANEIQSNYSKLTQDDSINISQVNYNPLKPFGLDSLKDSLSLVTSSSIIDMPNSSSENFDSSEVSKQDFSSSFNDENNSKRNDDSFEICFQDESQSQSKKERKSQSFSDDVDIIFEDKKSPAHRQFHSSQDIPSCNTSPALNVNIPLPPQSLALDRNKKKEIVDGRGDGKANVMQKLYLYIQMQLCQAESLKDWLSNNIIDRDSHQLLDIFHQIVRAISYVHRKGLMHRDLKPSNIFFAMDGTVKIGDFGLVTAVEEKCDDEGYASNQSIFQNNVKHTDQVGTTLYMSPEQGCRGGYTFKVDIYALGMIFFELFYPFETQMERLRTLTDVRKFVFPKMFLLKFTKECEFVKPLLSHDPDQRPSTKEILDESILSEFEEATQALDRLHSQSRQRTMSQSSGNSQKNSSSSHLTNSES